MQLVHRILHICWRAGVLCIYMHTYTWCITSFNFSNFSFHPQNTSMCTAYIRFWKQTFITFLSIGMGWGLSLLVLWPQAGYCTSLWIWRWVWEHWCNHWQRRTKALVEKYPISIVHHKSHMDNPGIEPCFSGMLLVAKCLSCAQPF